MNVKKILLTTDFSECSEHAFAPAATIARRNEAAVDLVNVVGALPPFSFGHAGGGIRVAEFHDDARRRLGGVVRNPVFDGVSVKPIVLDGFGPEAVDAYQRENGHDLVITATHGHSGLKRLVMGSFAERVVQLSHCPVLTFRKTSDETDFRPRKILVPCDFSELAKMVFPYVRELAARFESEIRVLHVHDANLFPVTHFPTSAAAAGVSPKYWDEAEIRSKKELEKVIASDFEPLPARGETAVGAPAPEIVAKARELEADLIVMSTHGRTGLGHAFLGSVAERVVRGAPCSVLTIRPES